MEKKIDTSKGTLTRKKIAKTFRWIIGITLVLIIIAWATLWFIRITDVVIADGLVEPKIKIEARAKIKETTLAERLCNENDSVKAGQTIATLYDQGRAKEAFEETNIKLDAENVNLKRALHLLERGLISEKETDEIKTRVAVLKNQNEIARTRMDDLNIIAPENGKIVYLPKKPGERVDLGELVCLIAGSDEVRLKILIESDDIGKVFIGQKAEVLWIGAFYRELIVGEALISRIYPYGFEKNGKFYFEAVADIYKSKFPLPLGVKLRARILGKKENLVTLILNSR
ncbi:MAG: HlyD family efflux transporter periplasmic adaptor subunit [Candidatus Omnitrophica bacterium]|nr:HlyD family efflux transporter periplasmic adaptor subunit [Candidatus Omnitrophota bacterium]